MYTDSQGIHKKNAVIINIGYQEIQKSICKSLYVIPVIWTHELCRSTREFFNLIIHLILLHEWLCTAYFDEKQWITLNKSPHITLLIRGQFIYTDWCKTCVIQKQATLCEQKQINWIREKSKKKKKRAGHKYSIWLNNEIQQNQIESKSITKNNYSNTTISHWILFSKIKKSYDKFER